ncbi:hypothetical protein F2Q70_00040712 [Brassica cretica]|uniref:Uncharacterized protein n=1 Tax=Brassica cretica TaxID=69181 RepID=A0A8S9K112_BRACR|nr:hypothetical protein F2Q70_00040712 [Brassica cretica]
MLHISRWRIVTSSNQCSFTELIHDDVELGINGVAHREEELTRFDRWKAKVTPAQQRRLVSNHLCLPSSDLVKLIPDVVA